MKLRINDLLDVLLIIIIVFICSHVGLAETKTQITKEELKKMGFNRHRFSSDEKLLLKKKFTSETTIIEYKEPKIKKAESAGEQKEILGKEFKANPELFRKFQTAIDSSSIYKTELSEEKQKVKQFGKYAKSISYNIENDTRFNKLSLEEKKLFAKAATRERYEKWDAALAIYNNILKKYPRDETTKFIQEQINSINSKISSETKPVFVVPQDRLKKIKLSPEMGKKIREKREINLEEIEKNNEGENKK